VRRLLLIAALAAVPGTLAAQASQFGVRGLGIPGQGISARAMGSAGGFSLFDAESSVNPAALAQLPDLTAVLTVLQDYRSAENPAGDASGRDTRFPLVMVAGPARGTPLTFAFGFSNYMVRDFSLATTDTILLRDQEVEVFDTLASLGGIGDIRFAAAYRASAGTIAGAAFHALTGSNRLRFDRTFGDESYAPIDQRAELSYAGVGVSAGVLQQVGSRLTIAGYGRLDSRARVELDSAAAYDVDLPGSVGVGIRWRPRPRVELAAQGIVARWSVANDDLLAQGGTGADNTMDLSAGLQYVTEPGTPSRWPIRTGVRYRTLPFPVVPGEQPGELTFAAGTGRRFAADRGGVDIAIQRVWRSAGEYTEGAWLFGLSVSVRP
jgi:hypothetical protein